LIREAATRRRAILSYASIHDSISELEQTLVGAGELEKAAEAHQYGTIVLRAYMAEIGDPEPQG
jgi:hypothetical protein